MNNPTTVHYCYRQRIQFPDEPAPRYIIPLGDPMVHEHPFDYLFDTPAEAKEHLEDCIAQEDYIAEEPYGGDLAAIQKDLVLVKVTVEPVG